MGKIKTFKDLDIWLKGVELVKDIYKVTESFPNHELYGLSSQMRRAAISIPSNVAEGFRRRHPKEFYHFLNIALGSSAELETQVVIASELYHPDVEIIARILVQIDHICRMVYNLMKKL